MEVKDNYTKKEVIKMLVSENNTYMRAIGDNKEFVIEGEEVVCYRVRRFFPNSELSRESFDFCILELE